MRIFCLNIETVQTTFSLRGSRQRAAGLTLFLLLHSDVDVQHVRQCSTSRGGALLLRNGILKYVIMGLSFPVKFTFNALQKKQLS